MIRNMDKEKIAKMPPMIVAHRGASGDAPENTLAAFRLGWEQGADAIEGDFHLTADGRIVCMHDATTGRTGDGNLSVAGHTLDELREVDVGRHKGPQFAGERIPTLAEVLQTVPAHGRVFLELKSGPAIVPAVKADLAVGFDPRRLMIIGFDAAVIAAAKAQMPEMKTAWLCGFHATIGGWSPTAQQVIETLRRVLRRRRGLQCARLRGRSLRPRVRQAGAGFHVWTVDDGDTARRFARMGVDSITTNRPLAIRKAIEESE